MANLLLAGRLQCVVQSTPRWLAFLAFALMAGQMSCARSGARSEAAYARVLALRRSDPRNARSQAKQLYDDFHGADSPTPWRFRLLYADVLLDANLKDTASGLLEGEPPSGPEHDALAARLAVSRVRLASKNADWTQAEQLHKDALLLLPAAQDECLRTELLALDVQNLIAQNRLQDSARQLTEMEHVAQSCSDPYWKAIRLYLNGTRLFAEFRFEEAIDSYGKALAVSRHSNFKVLVPLLLGNLAASHLSLGDSEAALQELNQAEGVYRDTGQEFDRSIDRGHLGVVYAMRQQYDKAEAEYRKARDGSRLAHYRPAEVRWLNELTALDCQTGKLDSAEEFNREALQKADHEKDKEEYAAAQLNGARIARSRNDLVAAYRLLQPVDTFRDSKYFRWQYQGERAQLLDAMNRPAEARHEFEAAIQTAESARGEVNDVWHRMTFSSEILDLYRRYVDFLIDHKDAGRALHLAESFHARQLLEKLHSSEELAPVDDFAKVARGQGAVILSYWVGARHSYMWITTAQGSHMFPLADTSKLEAQIQNYRREIDDRADFLHRPESSIALYKELIAPAARLIPENANVVVIPDGPLADLNFETLIAPETPSRYWMETVSLRVAPSLTLLHSKEPPPAKIASLLLVGGTKPPAPFEVLPGSQREIDSIKQLFDSDHPVVLSGNGATPEDFTQAHPERFSLIHLSAHAVTVKENPLDSAIIFTPEKQSGNFKLYARQLAAMKLSANLVTLSACRGAGARTVPGEGLVGFTWALLGAGAHNVVAGLWDVPDAASAQLMEQFYSGLQRGEAPGQALRSAKLQMRRQPPYYWAAFQLYSR